MMIAGACLHGSPYDVDGSIDWILRANEMIGTSVLRPGIVDVQWREVSTREDSSQPCVVLGDGGKRGEFMVRSRLRIPGEVLRQLASDVLISSGVDESVATGAADVLCTADEWGISSHGVARLRAYSEMLLSGEINPSATPRIVRERSSIVLIDGDNGLGMLVGAYANRVATERAKETGIGWVQVKNSNHFGIAGYYAVQGLKDDLVGLVMTNTPPLVTPFGGAERRLGTNPICMAVAGLNEPPVVIDFATSAISFGAVQNASRQGERLPSWSALDSEGGLSTEPDTVLAGGALLPLGGSRESGGHKGYCLASIVDLLCGVLPGASWGPFVPPFLNQAHTERGKEGPGLGHVFAAFSMNVFEDATRVRSRVDDWINTMRSTRATNWADSVQIPGDPERTAAYDSRANGVPMDVDVVEDLVQLARKFAVRFDVDMKCDDVVDFQCGP